MTFFFCQDIFNSKLNIARVVFYHGKNMDQRCPATLFLSSFCAGTKLNLFSSAQMTELPCFSNAPTARQIEPPLRWQQAVRISAAWLCAVCTRVNTWRHEYLKLHCNQLKKKILYWIFFCLCVGVGKTVHCR